jgi:hypothetical protein
LSLFLSSLSLLLFLFSPILTTSHTPTLFHHFRPHPVPSVRCSVSALDRQRRELEGKSSIDHLVRVWPITPPGSSAHCAATWNWHCGNREQLTTCCCIHHIVYSYFWPLGQDDCSEAVATNHWLQEGPFHS